MALAVVPCFLLGFSWFWVIVLVAGGSLMCSGVESILGFVLRANFGNQLGQLFEFSAVVAQGNAKKFGYRLDGTIVLFPADGAGGRALL